MRSIKESVFASKYLCSGLTIMAMNVGVHSQRPEKTMGCETKVILSHHLISFPASALIAAEIVSSIGTERVS